MCEMNDQNNSQEFDDSSEPVRLELDPQAEFNAMREQIDLRFEKVADKPLYQVIKQAVVDFEHDRIFKQAEQ